MESSVIHHWLDWNVNMQNIFSLNTDHNYTVMIDVYNYQINHTCKYTVIFKEYSLCHLQQYKNMYMYMLVAEHDLWSKSQCLTCLMISVFLLSLTTQYTCVCLSHCAL